MTHSLHIEKVEQHNMRQRSMGLLVLVAMAALLSWMWATGLRAQAPLPAPTAARVPAVVGRQPAFTARNEALPSETVPRPTVPQVPIPAVQSPAQAVEHPLAPVVRMYRESLARAEALQDYSFTFTKRELVDGQLTDTDNMFIKIRNRPFSVYLYCLGPTKPKGSEAIYVEGQNDGRAWVHTTGVRDRVVGTVSLDPTHPRLMEGNRYPLTNIGMCNLLRKVLEMYDEELAYGECEVRFIEGAKVDGRVCVCAQVVHPVRRKNFRAHMTRMFFDRETMLPIRWEAYSWPKRAGGEPELVEEYTYRNLKTNVGLTDADFDPANREYGFGR